MKLFSHKLYVPQPRRRWACISASSGNKKCRPWDAQSPEVLYNLVPISPRGKEQQYLSQGHNRLVEPQWNPELQMPGPVLEGLILEAFILEEPSCLMTSGTTSWKSAGNALQVFF